MFELCDPFGKSLHVDHVTISRFFSFCAFESTLNLRDIDYLYHWTDFVISAEVENKLSVLNASDEGSGD